MLNSGMYTSANHRVLQKRVTIGQGELEWLLSQRLSFLLVHLIGSQLQVVLILNAADESLSYLHSLLIGQPSLQEWRNCLHSLNCHPVLTGFMKSHRPPWLIRLKYACAEHAFKSKWLHTCILVEHVYFYTLQPGSPSQVSSIQNDNAQFWLDLEWFAPWDSTGLAHQWPWWPSVWSWYGAGRGQHLPRTR